MCFLSATIKIKINEILCQEKLVQLHSAPDCVDQKRRPRLSPSVVARIRNCSEQILQLLVGKFLPQEIVALRHA